MGQYWILVNLDKQEYINPRGCDDGMKLLELHDTLKATYLALTPIRALAVAINTGSNGSGGGDLALPYEHVEKPDSMPWKLARKLGLEKDMTPAPLFDVCGSWSGDRIVTAGDYGDDLDMLPQELHAQAWKESTSEHRQRCREEEERYGKPKPFRQQDVPKPNIYFWAHRHFTDITSKLMDVFTACGEGPFAPKPPQRWLDEVEDLASRYLWSDLIEPQAAKYRREWEAYSRAKDALGKAGRAANRKQPKLVWDLTWMPIEMFDTLMRRAADSPAKLASLKRFLRAHKLSKLVQDLLPHYKADNRSDNGRGREQHNFKKIQAILNLAGYNNPGEREANKRIMPDADLIPGLRALAPHNRMQLKQLIEAAVLRGNQPLQESCVGWAFGDDEAAGALADLPFAKADVLQFIKDLFKLSYGVPKAPKTLVEGVRRWLFLQEQGQPTTGRERVISLGT